MKPKYYLVGGAVRDKLLGVKCKDLDYAVEAESFEAMVEDVKLRGGEIFLSRPEYLTIRAKIPGHTIAADYVLCRRESFYSDGRRPDSVSIGTIEDDLARRDFTVNAIAETEDGVIVDPFGGQEDLEKRVLRCVGEANERFSEDYLRIVRAFRFAITKGFNLDGDIVRALITPSMIEKLEFLSKERIYEELRKAFEYDTMATLNLFDQFTYFKYTIFQRCGIKLLPKL